MREYRGKRIDTGEWMYGWYHKIDRADSKGRAFIIPSFASYLYSYEVDPSTVGQYTGLKDKNGQQLFKSDLWLYHGVAYIVSWNPDEAKFYFRHPNAFAGDDDHIELGWSTHGEKIGSIHDNPELLNAE